MIVGVHIEISEELPCRLRMAAGSPHRVPTAHGATVVSGVAERTFGMMSSAVRATWVLLRTRDHPVCFPGDQGAAAGAQTVFPHTPERNHMPSAAS